MQSSSSHEAIGEVPADTPRAGIIRLLRALDIQEVSYSLNGEGDSGDCELDGVTYRDGRLAMQLPDVPVGFSPNGAVKFLAQSLSDFAADLPEGDWVNNEGGFGSVTLVPFAEQPADWVVCDMTYRDEYDDEDDDFDDVDLDEETDDGIADPSLPIQIEEVDQ